MMIAKQVDASAEEKYNQAELTTQDSIQYLGSTPNIKESFTSKPSNA